MKNFMIRSMIYIAILIVLLLVTVISAKGIDRSKGKRVEDTDATYREAEQEYVTRIREILDEQGINSAGVMLTSVTEEDGRISYTLNLHHRIFGTEKLKSRSEKALREIGEVRTAIDALFEQTMLVYTEHDLQALAEANRIEDSIDDMTDSMTQAHIRRINKGEFTAVTGTQYLELTSDTERVADHLMNVANSIKNLPA